MRVLTLLLSPLPLARTSPAPFFGIGIDRGALINYFEPQRQVNFVALIVVWVKVFGQRVPFALQSQILKVYNVHIHMYICICICRGVYGQ